MMINFSYIKVERIHMKKFGLVSMLLGALLFISLGVTTASASGDKCGDGNKILQKNSGKCGNAQRNMSKCGARKCGSADNNMTKRSAGKCGDGKDIPKRSNGKCGVGKCGGN